MRVGLSCLDQHPLCAHYQRIERVWFGEFLAGKAKKVWSSLCPSDAIVLRQGMLIDRDLCVCCLLCAAYCPQQSIAFDENLRAYIVETYDNKGCVSAYLEREGKVRIKPQPDLIQGTPLSLIEAISNLSVTELVQLARFREHMSRDVNTLMQWSSNALVYLTSDQGGRVGYSVKVEGAEREIRIEMCHVTNGAISLWKFDNRINFGFIDRFMVGRERARVTAKSLGFNAPIYSCYLVGGRESDYFSSAGGIDQSVENRLKDYGLIMFSSEALWLLVARKLLLKKKIRWVTLLEQLWKQKNYLVLSDEECIDLIQKNTV